MKPTLTSVPSINMEHITEVRCWWRSIIPDSADFRSMIRPLTSLRIRNPDQVQQAAVARQAAVEWAGRANKVWSKLPAWFRCDTNYDGSDVARLASLAAEWTRCVEDLDSVSTFWRPNGWIIAAFRQLVEVNIGPQRYQTSVWDAAYWLHIVHYQRITGSGIRLPDPPQPGELISSYLEAVAEYWNNNL